MTKKEPRMFINPFSDDFLKTWDLWKEYKWESFNFKYKGVISEQASINHLVSLSEGEEEKAVKIVHQSLRRQWQGFFPLHETTTPNGKSKQSTSKAGETSLRDQSAAEFTRRNADGKQPPGGSNLKAV